MPKLPEFKNDAEMAEFWDTHSFADYESEFDVADDVKFVRPPKEVVALRLDEPVVRGIKRLARRKGLGYSSLIRMWLMERLETELGRRKTG